MQNLRNWAPRIASRKTLFHLQVARSFCRICAIELRDSHRDNKASTTTWFRFSVLYCFGFVFHCFCFAGVLKCYVMLQLFGIHLYCTYSIAIASVVFMCVFPCFMLTAKVACIIASCSLSSFPFLTSCFNCQCSMVISHVYFTMWNYHASSPHSPVFIFHFVFWGGRLS